MAQIKKIASQCLSTGGQYYMYDPGIPLTNFNDRGGGGGGGGVQQRFIFYTKKSQLQNLSTSKNHYFFLAYPKKFLCYYYFFLATQKITFGQNFRPKNHSDPPVIKICEWGPREPGGGGVLNLSLGRGVPPRP